MTNFQKKLLRPRILVPAIVLALAYTGFCLMVGFPWEDVMAKASAKKYVAETYRLTPTRMVTNFLLDYPMRVTVSTKEKEFDFDVYMDRGDLRNVTSDNYLQSMAEHRLRKRLDACQRHNGRAGPCCDFDIGQKRGGCRADGRRNRHGRGF